jgi:tRNA threonylcarbamoyladenosine biosynthesis protein TsaB
MLILAIDTSTRAGGAAITDGSTLLANVFEQPQLHPQGTQTPHANEEFSSRLFRYVESLLPKVGLSLPDIDVFAVTAGPGSFTGLRIGLTAVKAWSEVYGKPIAAISGLEAVAEQSSTSSGPSSASSSGIIAAFTDARRGQIYGGIFERTFEGTEGRLRSIAEEGVMLPVEFIESVSKLVKGGPVKFVSTAPELLRDVFAGSSLRNSSIEKVSEDLAPWVGRLAFGRAQRGELVNALTLDANYVRRMDAELYWKDS